MKIPSHFLNKTAFFLCGFYLSVTNIQASSDTSKFTSDDYIKEHTISVLPMTYTSIEDSVNPGLVIGRGNRQGIDTAKITDPTLKGISDWFYLDPIAAHHTSPQTPYSIIVKWPNAELAAALSDKFNAVIFDFGVLNYLGETGAEAILLRARFEEIMNLGGEEARRNLTGPVWKYQDSMYETFPTETATIEARYAAHLKEVAEKKQLIIEQGIQSAFASIKPKGHLFVPLEPRLASLNKSKIADILGISPEAIEEKSLSFGIDMSDSPLLPAVEKGDGFMYDTFKWLVISKA